MKAIHSIQYLRGIAAIMVVFVHIPVQLGRFGYHGSWPTFFNCGVDIFFVISGFIMWVTTIDSGITPQQFIYRRLVRIAPLYWVLTTVTVGVMLLSPSMVQSGVFDIAHVIKSFLFIPAQHPVTKDMAPVLVPGWTLNYEMFFYLIFAMCLMLRANYRAIALVGSLAVIACLQPLFPGRNTIGAFYTSSIILEFGLGVAIGALVTSGRTITVPFATGVMVFGVIGIVASGFYAAPRVVGWGIPAALIVLGAVMYERSQAIKRSGVLHTLGDASYSLYLVHGIVLSAFAQMWRKLGLLDLPASFFVFTGLSLVFVCLAAVVVYRMVERPLIAALRPPRRPAVA